MRKVIAIAAIVFGLVLVVGTFAMDSFGKARSGERLIDGARPTMENDVAVLRGDLDTLAAGTTELVDDAAPAIARELGMTTDEFFALVERDYPAISAALARLEEIGGALEATTVNLEAHVDDFEAADDLPVPGVSSNVMPPLILAFGIALVGAGVVALRTGGRRSLWAIGLLGVALAVPALVVQVPQKAADTEALLDSLNITTETASRTREQFEVGAAAFEQQQAELLPDLAGAFGVSTEQFVADLSRQFPAVGRTISETPAILDRIEGEVVFRESSVDEFADVRDLPMAAMSWALVIAGVVLVLAVVAAETLPARMAARHRPQELPGLAIPDS